MTPVLTITSVDGERILRTEHDERVNVLENERHKSPKTNLRIYAETIKGTTSLQMRNGSTDEQIGSLIYLYFIVSIGLILSIKTFIIPKSQQQREKQFIAYVDVFCILCMVVSLIWMTFAFCKKQNDNFVQFMDFPKRYHRPLLVAIYVFGVCCLVTDILTIWVLLKCIHDYPVTLVYSSIKLLFILYSIAFFKKFCSSVLFGARLPLLHILGTYVCLMIRTVLIKSRPILPTRSNMQKMTCDIMLLNPVFNSNINYIISFDQEFFVTAIVIVLVIWTNVKDLVDATSGKKISGPFLQAGNKDGNISMDSDMPSNISGIFPLSKTVPKEPSIDMGLLIGLVLGGILSMPYTFLWEETFIFDKNTELFVYHLSFLGLMFITTAIAFIKMRYLSTVPRIKGVAFPSTILLFFLIFCCLWHSCFSTLAAVTEMRTRNYNKNTVLTCADHFLFFIQTILQTCFIVKAYCCCEVALKPKSSNCVKQCALFLMVCNFVLWIHMVYFDLNHQVKTELQETFYGVKLWRVINKTTFPLCMYFRLFSSLCLFEICFLF